MESTIKILALIAEAFPGSAIVYNSLGEAYAVDGAKELAIENYKKAIANDPGIRTPRFDVQRPRAHLCQPLP